MALSEGTNYSYTPPKPKPQVNYGAPSGPYATPAASPAAVSLAHLQQTIKQPAMGPWQGMGQTELQRLGDPFAQDYAFAAYKRGLKAIPHSENPWEQRFAQGFWRTFDPRNYTPSKVYEGGKYAVQHPGDVLKQTFTTPEGLGGLTSGAALTAATGGGASAGVLSKLRAARAAAPAEAAIPRGVQWAPGAEAAIDRHFGGPGYTAAKRAALLKQAPSLAEVLAEKASMMKQVNSIMKGPSYTTRFRGGIGRAEGTQTSPVLGRNPMEGRYFTYTGHDKAIDPAQHMQEVIDRFDTYDDYFDEPNYDTGGGGGLTDERPSQIHNVHDEHGNVMGSLTYDFDDHPVHGKIVRAHEAYLRHEARGGLKYFNELVKPLKELGLPIDVMFANTKWAELMQKMHERGRVKLTDATLARIKNPDPDMLGIPNEKGVYPYEVPQHLQPRLMKPMSPTFTPFSPGRYNPNFGQSTPVQGLPGLRNWGQANTGGFPRRRPFFYGGL